MPGCCIPKDYDKVFSSKEAQWYAGRYRKKGLDPTARQMVDFLVGRGVHGNSILEVGGGIGAIQLELLRAGATRSMNVELSPAYEDVARRLFEEAGLQDRVERHIMDFAAHSGAFAPADIVAMHRVVCCYPDMGKLVAAAASRARRHLAISFPREGWWVRLGIWLGNLWLRLRRTDFRAYLHSPTAILAVTRTHGFLPVMEHSGWLWKAVVLEKTVTVK